MLITEEKYELYPTLQTCPLDSSIFSWSLLRRISTVENFDSSFPPLRTKKKKHDLTLMSQEINN